MTVCPFSSDDDNLVKQDVLEGHFQIDIGHFVLWGREGLTR